MLTPKSRGVLSEALFEAMRRAPETSPDVTVSPESGEDAAIALWALYELHYRGFDDCPDDLEWHPALLRLRLALEIGLESRLRARFVPPSPQGPFAEAFFDYVANHDGLSLAAYVRQEATRDQVLDLLRWRSIYHLKESDPTAWVVPRLSTGPKAALMELLYDEYGVGDPHRVHAQLFATGIEKLGLRADYGAYINDVPLEILEQNNAMSLFGLHRRLRGAALGHLAAFEATSSHPSRRMAQGLERLSFATEMRHYYEEHVEADAVHEQLAVRSVCGGLLESEPNLADDVYFGAWTALDLEDRVARHLFSEWGVKA